MKQQYITGIIAIIILGGIAGIYFGIRSQGTKIEEAPDFKLVAVGTENSFNISDLRPNVVLIDFFGYTCAPCKKMNPLLVQLSNDTEVKNNLTIISINVEGFTTDEQLIEYGEEYNFTWPICQAPQGMTEKYGVTVLPTFVIINGEGKITAKFTGEVKYEKLKNAVVDAISGKSEGVNIINFEGFAIGFAIITGIASFFSPCSFPLLPGYVAHIFGINKEAKKDKEQSQEKEGELTEEKEQKEEKKQKPLGQYIIIGLFGSIGILTSYMILGILISSVGAVVLSYIPYLLPIVGSFFLIFGILLLFHYSIQFNTILGWIRRKQINAMGKKDKSEFWSKVNSTFWYGLGYGLASLGCNAPVFLAFSLNVASQEKISTMIFAYLAFILTIVILMVGVTIAVSASKDLILNKLKGATATIQTISGIILIGVAIFLFVEFFTTGV